MEGGILEFTKPPQPPDNEKYTYIYIRGEALIEGLRGRGVAGAELLFNYGR